METKRDRKAWLAGGSAQCNLPPHKNKTPLRLVLLGAPGVGKGTQAEMLCDNLGTCHLSTGDIFRAAKALEPCQLTPALTAALEYMRRGDLVPDETVLAMVTERVRCLHCEGGFLLDGFPRTVAQAEALDNLLETENLQLNAVLSYDLPIEQVVARLSGRRTCADCKAVFHIAARPPRTPEVCDHCNGKLYQREDDRLDEELLEDVVIGRADRFAQADLARSFGHRDKHDVHDADAADDERYRRDRRQEDRKDRGNATEER